MNQIDFTHTKNFTPKHVANLFFPYKSDTRSKDLSVDFTLNFCLLGYVKLTNTTDQNKYFYLGYGIGFASLLLFSYPDFNWGKTVIVFGVVHQYLLIIRKWYLSSWW